MVVDQVGRAGGNAMGETFLSECRYTYVWKGGRA